MAESGGKVAAAAAAEGGTAGQQIDAFTAQQILQEGRIVCLEAWNQYALLGLSDGTLLLASPRPAGSSARSEAGGSGSGGEAEEKGGAPAGALSLQGGQLPQGQPTQPGQQQHEGRHQQQQPQQVEQQWAAVQTLRGFGQGGVKQLVVAKERSMLLCLAGDGVNAFALPGLRLKGQAGRTRGASLFAWHGGTDTLAAAVKRRMLLFKYDGLEFVEQREVALPDAPACMALAGGTLYVGLAKRDYVAIDVGTGTLSQLFATKGAAPCMAAVSPSEVLLSRDSSSVLYGGDGRPAKRGAGASGNSSKGAMGNGAGAGTLAWAAPPAALAVSVPYAVAFAGEAAEARLVEPLDSADLWQHLALPLPAAATTLAVAPSAAPDGSLFVASREAGVVLQLRPVGFLQQAEQLLQLGEHEEALAMVALAGPGQAAQRRRLEDAIHLAFGQRLFREGAYEEAMLHFGMSSLAGPLELLRLFPSLAPPRLLAAATVEQVGEEEEGAGVQGPEARRGAAGEPAESGEGRAASEGEPQGEAFVAAVQHLTPYLLSHRSRLAAAAASPTPPQPPPQQRQQKEERRRHAEQRQLTPAEAAVVPEAQEPGPSPASRAVLAQRRLEGSATAALLDTALLLALLALPDSGALLRFVQRPNCVDLRAGEAALRGAGRYSELVALYQTKGRHAAALELLHALSQRPEQLPAAPQGASAELRGLPGVWAAVKYVCHMPEGERDLSLLSTHARWILAADPDAGLEMFANMQPPLTPGAALPMLTSYAPQLAGPYLEGALASGAAPAERYEQELARIYLERLVGGAQAGAGAAAAAGEPGGREGAAGGDQPPEALPEYGKLRQLILGSRFLDCEVLLRVAPQRRLLEVRAALLERLGRHTEALRIFVHGLRSPALAEAYCDRVYQRRQLALRERRRAELAAAMRRQRQQHEAAAAAASGGPPAVPPSGGRAAGTARGLQFEDGPAAPAVDSGTAATKLQPALTSSSVSEGGAEIYLLLIQALLEEEDGAGGFRPVARAPDHAVWGEVACLLSRKRDAIPPLRALGLLPGEVALSSALPFLEGALWGAVERRRFAVVARSLRRSEHVGLLGHLADARQRSVLLTPERNCSICYKRVGTAALVAFPSGLLAHYSCWRRASAAGGQAAAAANGGSAARGWH